MTSPDCFDIRSFCEANHISRGFFYKIAAEGKGPRTIRIGRKVLISREAAAEWRQRMEADDTSANSHAR
jgi:predicted DNA-binding transcriptional regulator AlpA